MTRIVELDDKAPLILRKSEMEKEAVAICRCGLAASWPYCDGSHTAARNEAPDHQYKYTRNDEMELEQRELEQPVKDADPHPRLP